MMKNPDQAISLPELCCLKIHGSDATDFLQSQLSIDVHKLLPGGSRLGAYCEPKGRVISTFILSLMDDTFFMLIPTVLKETVVSTLLRYRFRAKVKFETTAETHVYGYYPESADIDTLKQPLCFPHPLDNQRGFILQAVKESSMPTDMCATNHWAKADIAVAMVWLDLRTTVKHLPQSLGLVDNNAVDFDKGCYPGQEIIARLKYLGQSKYTICQFTAEIDCAEFKTTDRLRDSSGKLQGQRLNSVCHKHNANGLFAIKHTALEANTELFLTNAEGDSLGIACAKHG